MTTAIFDADSHVMEIEEWLAVLRRSRGAGAARRRSASRAPAPAPPR